MNSLSMPLETFSGKAACNRNKSEDLPCILYHCFRGKSVESNERDKFYPIISFIKTLSKKVKENKLCQVYLNDVRPK
jgi:hypothetical protein